MIPPDAFVLPDPPTTCAQCDGPLGKGRRVACAACELAARVAIERADGRVVRPSDVQAARGEE